MERHRLLLIAQSPVLRMGIRAILEHVVELDQVLECGNALDAVSLLASGAPDIVLIQDTLPGVTGQLAVDVVRHIRPEAVIVLLVDTQHGGQGEDLLEPGAANLALPSDVDPARFVEEMRRLIDAQPLTAGAIANPLSAMEIAVLDGLVRGLNRTQIADSLLISEPEIRVHQGALLTRLEAADPASAVVQAVRGGFVDLSVQLPEGAARTEPDFSSAA